MIIKCPECGAKTDFGPKTKGRFLCEECEEELDPADALPRRKLKKKAKKSNSTLYIVLGGVALTLMIVLGVVAIKKGWFKGSKATSDEVADGYGVGTHVAAHLHAWKDTRRKAGSTDRTGRAMEHRTVSTRTALEAVAFDYTLESAALGDTDNIDHLVCLELFGRNLVAGLVVSTAITQLELAAVPHPVRASLLKVAGCGLIDPRRLDVLHQTELNGVITVGGRRLALRDDTRTSLHQRDRYYLSVGAEDLRHADFFT